MVSQKVISRTYKLSDADYAGSKTDKKSTNGTCQFLGHMLVSWSRKKQNFVVFSTAEAEYIASGSYCAKSYGLNNN